MKTILIFLLFILISSSFAQQDEGTKYNPLSSKTAFGISGGMTYANSDFRETKLNYLLRANADHYIPTFQDGIFGINLMGAFGYASGKGRPAYRINYTDIDEFRTQIMILSGGLSYTFTGWPVLYPYATVSGGWINYQPKDKDGNELPLNKQNKYSVNDWFASGEFGVKFPLGKYVSFNLSASAYYLPFDNLDDSPNEITGGSDKDMLLTFLGGLQLYFGGIKDSDNDGVTDKNDLCPDTPAGVIVDQFGCPVDTDKDGVPDYLDDCPNTPVNIPVDEMGCPSDADDDGIPDFRDLCPDTPAGVPVDQRGCPFDSDGDGVPDYKDLCPDTPIGVEVDKWGCEINEKVTTVLPETKFILSGTLNFETGKSDLLPNALGELDKMIAVMKEYPDTKWRIEGHTDNTGSYNFNKQLSLDRAQTVFNYLTSRGIDKNRFLVLGMGPDNPIADNSTETGRSLNRRVAIVMIDENTNFSFTPGITDISDYKYNPLNEKNVGGMIFTDGKVYTVQVSSWRDRIKAESEVKRLKAAGYNAFVVEVELPDLDGVWHRVRVGFYNTIDEVKRVKAILLQLR